MEPTADIVASLQDAADLVTGKDWPRLLRLATRLSERHPQSADILCVLAFAHAEQGDYAVAADLVDAIETKLPRSLPLLFLGSICSLYTTRPRSLVHYMEAIEELLQYIEKTYRPEKIEHPAESQHSPNMQAVIKYSLKIQLNLMFDYYINKLNNYSDSGMLSYLKGPYSASKQSRKNNQYNPCYFHNKNDKESNSRVSSPSSPSQSSPSQHNSGRYRNTYSGGYNNIQKISNVPVYEYDKASEIYFNTFSLCYDYVFHKAEELLIPDDENTLEYDPRVQDKPRYVYNPGNGRQEGIWEVEDMNIQDLELSKYPNDNVQYPAMSSYRGKLSTLNEGYFSAEYRPQSTGSSVRNYYNSTFMNSKNKFPPSAFLFSRVNSRQSQRSKMETSDAHIQPGYKKNEKDRNAFSIARHDKKQQRLPPFTPPLPSTQLNQNGNNYERPPAREESRRDISKETPIKGEQIEQTEHLYEAPFESYDQNDFPVNNISPANEEENLGDQPYPPLRDTLPYPENNINQKEPEKFNTNTTTNNNNNMKMSGTISERDLKRSKNNEDNTVLSSTCPPEMSKGRNQRIELRQLDEHKYQPVFNNNYNNEMKEFQIEMESGLISGLSSNEKDNNIGPSQQYMRDSKQSKKLECVIRKPTTSGVLNDTSDFEVHSLEHDSSRKDIEGCVGAVDNFVSGASDIRMSKVDIKDIVNEEYEKYRERQKKKQDYYLPVNRYNSSSAQGFYPDTRNPSKKDSPQTLKLNYQLTQNKLYNKEQNKQNINNNNNNINQNYGKPKQYNAFTITSQQNTKKPISNNKSANSTYRDKQSPVVSNRRQNTNNRGTYQQRPRTQSPTRRQRNQNPTSILPQGQALSLNDLNTNRSPSRKYNYNPEVGFQMEGSSDSEI